jgi:ketosteroid isomerase-like protein
MSQENVEVARGFYEEGGSLASGRDPLPSLREFCDPVVEWDFSRREIDGEIYHGYEGWLRFAEQQRDAWLEFRYEAEEIIDAGDSVVVFSHNIGLAKSGIRLGVRVGQVLTLRDGKIVHYQYFGEDRAACLEAVELEE